MSEVETEEELSKVHEHCKEKYNKVICPVCNEPAPKLVSLPEELKDKVYRPGDKSFSKETETYTDINEESDEDAIIALRELLGLDQE